MPFKHSLFAVITVTTVIAAGALTSCDPEGRKECEWALEPEPSLVADVNQPGMIPVCARNRKTNKQDCRFQTTLELAKSAWNRKFRYDHIDANMKHLPRIINKITFCDEK
jgi:hypothetical protein